jgi:Immunity protein 74
LSTFHNISMFHSPHVNLIKSDSGFSIEMLGRTGIEYRESDKAMFIESEILMTDVPTVAIWKDQIRAWKPPHETELVTQEKRTEILKRICAALKWRSTQVEIYSQATGWVKGWLE